MCTYTSKSNQIIIPKNKEKRTESIVHCNHVKMHFHIIIIKNSQKQKINSLL